MKKLNNDIWHSAATQSDEQEVKEEFTRLVPGATLVTTSGFGDAVINNM